MASQTSKSISMNIMKMYFTPAIHAQPSSSRGNEVNTGNRNVVASKCDNYSDNNANDNDNANDNSSFEIPSDILESIIKDDESNHNNNNHNLNDHHRVYNFTKPISTRKITPVQTKINFNSILSSLSSLTSHNTANNSTSIQHSFERFCLLYTHPQPYSSSLITQQHHFNAILSSIRNSATTTLTPTFTGPYIIGSASLSFAFPTEIDLLYTCSNLHALYSHNNFIIKNLIVTTCVNICKVEYDTFVIDHNKQFTLFKCKVNIKLSNIVIYVYVMDKLDGDNERIVNEVYLKRTKVGDVFSEKGREDKVMLALLLRKWRKRFRLEFVIPEVLDKVIEKYYDGFSVSGSFVKICYLFYVKDVKVDGIAGELVKMWFSKGKKVGRICEACKETVRLIEKEEFERLFE